LVGNKYSPFFSSLVRISVEISEFIFPKCPSKENFESKTVIHLARKTPSAVGGEGLGACSGPELTLMLPSECGHGDSRILNVIFYAIHGHFGRDYLIPSLYFVDNNSIM